MNAKRLVGAAALVVLTACGSTGSGVSSAATGSLNSRIAAIRAAAAHGNRALSTLRVAQLRSTLATLHDHGQVSDEAETRILHAAQTVEARLTLLPAPTTTSTTTTTKPEPDEHPKGPGKGEDKGPGPKHRDKHDDKG